MRTLWVMMSSNKFEVKMDCPRRLLAACMAQFMRSCFSKKIGRLSIGQRWSLSLMVNWATENCQKPRNCYANRRWGGVKGKNAIERDEWTVCKMKAENCFCEWQCGGSESVTHWLRPSASDHHWGERLVAYRAFRPFWKKVSWWCPDGQKVSRRPGSKS